MDMPPEVRIGLISAEVVATIAVLLLVFGDRPELAAAIRRRLAGRTSDDMSSTDAESTAEEPIAAPLPATATNDGQRIAMPGNAVNAELPGNVLPEAAREIIRYQVKVEDAVKLIQSGKIGQTEVIELVFNCKRSGRADSPYGKARAAVLAQLGPVRPEYVGEMIERVQREVAEEASR
jgi:hypothetical protein